MGDPALKLAAKLREIAEHVKAWERRDMEESGKLSRPAYFADLEKVASILDGTNAQFACTLTPRQNWPEALSRLNRDFAIAEFVHSYRNDPCKSVAQGIEDAAAQFGIGKESVKRANRELGKYFRDGNADLAAMMRALEVARLARRG